MMIKIKRVVVCYKKWQFDTIATIFSATCRNCSTSTKPMIHPENEPNLSPSISSEKVEGSASW